MMIADIKSKIQSGLKNNILARDSDYKLLFKINLKAQLNYCNLGTNQLLSKIDAYKKNNSWHKSFLL